MSEGSIFWLSLAEKFLGVLITIIGALFLYFTATSTGALGAFTGLFSFLGIAVLLLGVFLLLVKPPE
ncbi:MAG: hypothetical protein QXL10_00075 [Candidatus Bathyarchaeia archaeon]